MKTEEKKDLSGDYGWNVSNFIEANNLYDLAREKFMEFKDMSNDEMMEKIYEWDSESGWDEMLDGEYVRHYPHPEYGDCGDDYSLIQNIEKAEEEALHEARYIFGIRGKYQILKRVKKPKKK